jgi:hypothetical protein
MPATTPRSPGNQGERPRRDRPILPDVLASAAEFDRLVRQTGRSPKQIVKNADGAFSEAAVSRWRRGVDNLIPSDEALAILFELANEPQDGRQRVAHLVMKARQAKEGVRGAHGPDKRVRRAPRVAAAVIAVGALAVPQVLGDIDSLACQQRARFRVTEPADVKNEKKTTIGRAGVDDVFVVLDEPVHVDYRRYGAVGDGGLVGYVLMNKLEFIDTITACP